MTGLLKNTKVVGAAVVVLALISVGYYYWGTGIYADAIAGADHSERLNEWLTAGGASLCARAAQQLK